MCWKTPYKEGVNYHKLIYKLKAPTITVHCTTVHLDKFALKCIIWEKKWALEQLKQFQQQQKSEKYHCTEY